ncbi:hypothetical protein L218DRAFT_845214, partial [Marasmius fiardii PR-910]
YTFSWSDDESGKTCFTDAYCQYLGLPTILRRYQLSTCVHSWPTKIYKAINKWQVARGFDPTTTDFAHYLGYPIYEII